MAYSVSIVVPVYRSAEILPRLLERLGAVLDALPGDHEIVLVDDGSPDGSFEVIQELARGRRNVRGIRLMRNYGQHNALLCGIRAASKEVVVTLDDDLQNPPEEIPRLLAKLAEGHD